MDILCRASPFATTSLSTELPKSSIRSSFGLSVNQNCCFVFGRNAYSSVSSFSSLKISVKLRKSTTVVAKKDNKKEGKKVDAHSFIAKSDEATGPFPEAVLLKERKVQEDGRLLPEFADTQERELFELLNLRLESDLNVEQMRHYEVVYMIHEDHAKDVESVNSKVQDFIKEKNGKIYRFDDWGLRRLAYKIRKAKNAHYLLMNFELEAKVINDFKDMLDKDERVIRHLVMKKDKAETEDCPPPPEFHTLHPAMDDDEDGDDEYDDGEYDDEEDGDEYDEEEDGEDEYDDEEDGDDEYDDEEDGDNEYDADNAYDDEDDDEDSGEDEDGEAGMTGDGKDSEEGIVYVDDYIEEYRESKNGSKPSTVSSKGRMKLRPKQVGR